LPAHEVRSAEGIEKRDKKKMPIEKGERVKAPAPGKIVEIAFR
jgi:hypothetical protein